MSKKILKFIFLLILSINNFIVEKKRTEINEREEHKKPHDIDQILEKPNKMFDIEYDHHENAVDDELPEEFHEFMNQMHGIDFDHYEDEELIKIGENQYEVPPDEDI